MNGFLIFHFESSIPLHHNLSFLVLVYNFLVRFKCLSFTTHRFPAISHDTRVSRIRQLDDDEGKKWQLFSVGSLHFQCGSIVGLLLSHIWLSFLSWFLLYCNYVKASSTFR